MQPLFMQVISLFVVGYIARKLGTADFGIFNFVTTFTMLFYPLAILGLNRLTVRDMAGAANVDDYGQKMVALRLINAFFSIGLIVIIANMANYPSRIVYAIYLACAIFMFQLMSESLTDIFNAFQMMEYTALAGIVAGLSLTTLSVIVLYLGYGLYELLAVYILGQAFGLAISIVTTVKKKLFALRLKFDGVFSLQKLKEGTHFFMMTMMWFAMMRIDTVFLSKKVSMEDLGLYTSALLLVTKLSFIPHAISSALLPAFSQAFKSGDIQEIANVFSGILTKVAFLMIPFVIVISVFSEKVVSIVFGQNYIGGASILRIGIWSFLFTCISFCEFSLLTAVHRQKLLLNSYLISALYCVVSNLILIYFFKMNGAVLAFTTTQLLLFSLFTFYTIKLGKRFIQWKSIWVVIFINIVFFSILSVLKPFFSMYSSIPVATLVYLVIAYYTKLISINDIKQFKHAIRGV